MDEGVLDKPGDWEIRVTIYRNGRRVGTCDTSGHETFESAAYWAGQGLETREIEMHVSRARGNREPDANMGVRPKVNSTPATPRRPTQ